MKVLVLITAGELIDRGLWDRACDLLGIGVWAVNEGQMDSGEELTLTEEQAADLGLLPTTDARRMPDSWH